MNKKIGFVVAFTLFLVVALFNVPLTFAQHWDDCKVSAYGTYLIEMKVGKISWFEFKVVSPPAGSEITNTIYVINYSIFETYTKNLEAGDYVIVRYDDFTPDIIEITTASDGLHYSIYFEGEVGVITINAVFVPEFSPMLIVPMFITATALAIIYRRKRTSQNQTTD